MVEEVLQRIDLIVMVGGSRRISNENLTFLFDKYELSEEEREEVIASCKEKRITIFDETPASARVTVKKEEEAPVKEETPAPKKGLFGKLFGKR